MIGDRRKRLAIFLLVFLLVVLLLIWLLWALFHKETQPEVVVVEQPVAAQNVIPSEPQISPIAEQKRDDRIQVASLNTVAKTFVERYGSYSNEANFQNLRDVLSLMSASFAAETQSFIDTSIPPAVYYGVTTRVITVDLQAMDETAGTASLALTTQREEAVESPEKTQVKYQMIQLELVKEEGAWKVASATWL